jgi:hypothetical protein
MFEIAPEYTRAMQLLESHRILNSQDWELESACRAVRVAQLGYDRNHALANLRDILKRRY